mmetsp:Transcript_15705/g.45897  ORF Transcript_15705/g.45897 Transcript_15705/m.45897 type:complete len:203 (+) Transcript_15705:1410-2018(+)
MEVKRVQLQLGQGVLVVEEPPLLLIPLLQLSHLRRRQARGARAVAGAGPRPRRRPAAAAPLAGDVGEALAPRRRRAPAGPARRGDVRLVLQQPTQLAFAWRLLQERPVRGRVVECARLEFLQELEFVEGHAPLVPRVHLVKQIGEVEALVSHVVERGAIVCGRRRILGCHALRPRRQPRARGRRHRRPRVRGATGATPARGG